MEGKMLYKPGTYGTNVTSLNPLNIPKDLSLINRKNHDHTNKHGVPLVYHVKCTVYSPSYAGDADRRDVIRFLAVPQNWVYRNAAVKLHAAREKMFQKNGITKKERGRYSKTIRYQWDQAESWQVPLQPDTRVAYTSGELGTWDTTNLILSSGGSVDANLWQREAVTLTDEDTTLGEVPLAVGYLTSRQVIREDNQDSDTIPAKQSMIVDLFDMGSSTDNAAVRDLAQGEQDNPPYDADALQGTFYNPCEVGRVVLSQNTGAMTEIYMDIPFGIAGIEAQSELGSTTTDLEFAIEVLGVSEMQG